MSAVPRGVPIPDAPILVKCYGRRRLYDTAAARYVTLDELRGWAADDIRFVVVDTETGAEVTRMLLA